MEKILSKLFFIFVIFGWVNTLHAECSENEIKAIISQKVNEFKKEGFFGFMETWWPDPESNEARYYFTAKKHGPFGDKFYGGMLLIDTKFCGEGGFKEINIERLKPLNISKFKNEKLGANEGCSLNKVKKIIYENLSPSDEYTKWSYPYGSLMKSWEYYEFIYMATSGDPAGKYHTYYLNRVEITKFNCEVRRDDMIAIGENWVLK